MDWFVEKFVNLLVDATAYIADTFGNSILGLLTMNVGSGKSFFDLVFSSVGNFYQYFVIIAIAFLLINYVWQLSKMMFLSQGSNDTPLSLTAWTIIAGCLIYAGQRIIYIFEGFFNIIYGALLNAKLSEATEAAIDFSGISDNMTTALASGDSAGGPTSTAGSIGALLLTLFLLLMLAYQFIMFLIEMAERYIVLGVLYYTCPFAFSMLGSKSTSNIFASWVRMIGSQLFLMLCNVIFFRLFMMGLNSYDGLLETYKQQIEAKAGIMANYNLGTVVIVWVLMMHGILAVATRVDSYLNTLGLSAAQTGRGLAGAMVASAMGVRRALAPIKEGRKKLQSKVNHAAWDKFKQTREDRKTAEAEHKAAGERLGEAIRKREAESHVYTDENGNISAGSFKNAMDKNIVGDELSKLNGMKAADSFIKHSSLNGTDFAKGIEKTSFKTREDGTFSMKWRDPKTGQVADIDVATLDPDLMGHSNVATDKLQGRTFTMTDGDGNQIQMFAAATGDGADAFNSYNPAMEKTMADFNQQENCSAEQVAPGVWQTTRTDDAGNVIEAKEYSCASMYGSDVALNSSTEQIGDMSYNVSDITAATTGPVVSTAANPAQDFNEILSMGDVSNVKQSAEGAFTMDINGQKYMATSSALWDIPANTQNVQTMYASSTGAEYKLFAADPAIVPIKRATTLGDGARAHGVFATPKTPITNSHTQHHSAPPKPPMYRTAQHRANIEGGNHPQLGPGE